MERTRNLKPGTVVTDEHFRTLEVVVIRDGIVYDMVHTVIFFAQRFERFKFICIYFGIRFPATGENKQDRSDRKEPFHFSHRRFLLLCELN